MQPVRSDVNLRPLFTKLGHQLEEIRVRSLTNIISKLDHNVICEADLVQEKYFIIRLLEWFNFPTVPMQNEVISLLDKLSKHSSAAKILVDVGGVEFLSQLRPNSEPQQQVIIDETLENLLRLPDIGEDEHRKECIYHQHSPSRDGSVQNETRNTKFTDSISQIQHTQIADTHSSKPFYEIQEPQVGYFVQEHHHSVLDPTSRQSHATQASDYEMTSCFQFSTFPWLPLTSTDRHVLTSTDSSLRSPNPTLVGSSCEFLSEVVLQDFPAEIFLQRPNIVQSLLALLKLKPPHDHNLPLSAVKCLTDLCIDLQSRIVFYHDPALYCPKQVDFGFGSGSGSHSNSTLQSTLSSGSRPSVLGHSGPRLRGDGQDGDSSSATTPTPSPRQPTSAHESGSDSDLETDCEDMIALQFSQITVPQFCVLVLEHGTPLLKTSNAEMVLHCTQLLNEVLGLLKQAVSPDIWDEKSVVAREVAEKVVDVLEVLGDVLLYHHHSRSRLSDGVSEHDIRQHRLAFMAVTMYVMQLMETLMPVEKAKDLFPESLNTALCLIAMDPSLCHTYPNVQQISIKYLSEVDEKQYQIYKEATAVCESMEATCRFLNTTNEQDDISLQVQISRADQALDSVAYHSHMPLVDAYVNMCSEICKPVNANPNFVAECRKVLLKYLAHPISKVKIHTYLMCLNIVKDGLGISQASSPGSLTYFKVKFLLDPRIIREIASFGVNDAEDQVSLSAREILLYMLQGKLLMSSGLWKQVIDAMVPVFPILQSYAEKQTNLGSCILGLTHRKTNKNSDNAESDEPLLPTLEQLRSTLRLMFSKSASVRSETIKYVLEFLAKEDDSVNKLPSLTQATLTDMGNLLIMDQPIILDDQQKSVFQVDGLLKVYNILTSPTVELEVRKSAAEQLAVILQDVTLHQAFMKHNGLDKIMELIKSALVKPAESKEQEQVVFIPACLTVLRELIHQDYSLRHQLAHDFTIYFILIRSALLFASDDRVRYEASHILTLLLFDEVASLDSESSSGSFEIKRRSGFSLPKCVLERFRLPFKAYSQSTLSPYRVDVPPSSDPLVTGPPAEMLTMGWNIAWHHGIAPLATFVKNGKKQKEDGFASKLHLSRVERILLCCTHKTTAIVQCLESMLQASSHFMVKTALYRLTHYVLCESIGVDSERSESRASKLLFELDWKEAFGRFLQVIPANMEDESLLAQILSFMSALLDTSNNIPEEFLTWLADIIVDNHAPLTRLLQKSENYGEASEDETSACKRALRKSILVFLSGFVKTLTKFNHKWKFGSGLGCIGGDITQAMIQSLHLADAVHFYNLPSLEGTLQCLVHVTARPGWSNGCMDIDNLSLCHKFLSSLLEVVSAFHVGRGGTAMSYMGKGVTKSATMCLLHVAYEMSQYSVDKTWTSHWLYIRQGNRDELMSTGLLWLLSLWYYRDPEIRATGLGIASALSSTEPGRIMLSSCCQQIPGGLWGTVLTFLLDQSECSVVRQQAAALLVNLTSQLMPSTTVSDPSVKWQGPSVQDEESQVSLVGLPALIALLHHYQFYPEIVTMLNNYYADSTIVPVSIMDDMSAAASSVNPATPSPSTLITTVDNGTFNASHVPTTGNTTHEQRSSTIYTSTPNTTRTSAGATGTPNMTTSTTSMQTNSMLSSKPSSQPQGSAGPSSSSSQSSTVTPPSTAADVRYPSVVTPSLIGTICQSLRNMLSLAPQDTHLSISKQGILKSLLRLLDVDLLESKLQQLDCKDGILLVDSLFMMYSESILLVRAVIQCDATTRKSLLQDSITWRKFLHMLGLFRRQNIKDAGLESSCHTLLSAIFQLLMTTIQLEQTHGVKELTPFLAKFWTNIVDCIDHVLNSSTSSPATRQSAMNFLTALLTEDGKQNSSEAVTINSLLDGEQKDSNDKDEVKQSGQILCEVLLTAADGNLPTSSSATAQEKISTMSALSTLLAGSHTAKAAAMHAGLVESTVDQIKHIHVKLNMDSLQLGKPTKKKEDPLMTDLINQLNLLQNFMYQSEMVKMVAFQCGLSDVVHKLWSWCTVETNLMQTMLSLLCTYTARCDTTCKSLAYTSPTSISSTGPSSNSLVHSLVKFANRENSNNKQGECSETQRCLFSLLSTLVLSSECRGILWKSNFLQSFSKVQIPKKGSKGKKFSVSLMWLKLLVNLSFSSEGQQMIMKIPDSLELLLEYIQCSHQQVQLSSLLVLRNLCFHGACKPKLLASDKLLPYFLDTIHNLCLQMKYTAVTALWALVYNSQKAKVSLKNGAVGPKLMEAYNKVKNTTYAPQEEEQFAMPCLNAMQTVIALVNE